MRIASHQGTKYEATDDDILWLKRAVEAEGAPRDLVAQTLLNCFLWARESLRSTRTLAQFVQSYAQPVNPAWMLGGKKFDEALKTARTDAERARVRSDAYRREHEHATRVRFSRSTTEAVEKAFRQSPQLPGATDYAASFIRNRQGELVPFLKPAPWVPMSPAQQGRNRFWMRPGAAGWLGYVVEQSRGTTGGVGAWLLVGIGVAWMLARRA